MIDRTKEPLIQDLTTVYIPPTEMYSLANGVQVCEINSGSQEVLRIDIVHKAGRSMEQKRIVSRATASLLKEGCAAYNSNDFAELVDYYGAGIKTASNMDFSYSTLYTIDKHGPELIHLLHAMYSEPLFDGAELEKFKKQNIQKLREELSKNEVLSFRCFTEEIFGAHHPYGYNSTEEDYKSLNSEDLVSHFNDFYGTDNCNIFLSGKISDTTRKTIAALFGRDHKLAVPKEYAPAHIIHEPRTIEILSKNKHQSALKMGFRLFERTHPDQAGFFVLNTILGGYFGSRLMMNIREDKGYTYDIASLTDQMLYDGCFYIDTEADPQYMDDILIEIYKEIDILKNEKVKTQELKMVKNYLMGNFMNMLDGPINVASVAKTMVLTGQKPNDFQDFVRKVLEVSSDDILNLAQKYLDTHQFLNVLVNPGKKV